MNTTTDSGGGALSGYSNIGGLGYGIGVSVGILVLITTITLASYFCTRGLQPAAANNNNHQAASPDLGGLQIDVVQAGLDEATIESYPKLTYSEAAAKLHSNDNSTIMCCSICLADYKPTDMLRSMPDCGHLFHNKCVDPWLRLHPTCPVCRSSPMPTPLSTPLAEVVPLAGSRQDIPI